MAKREGISASIRWSVFARDGFCCRYCGRQAGQDGVTLEADHVVSVVDGGDNRIDNLVTACKTCNGGKSGRSLLDIPSTEAVVARLKANKARSEHFAETVQAAIDAEAEAEQSIVNMKCAAYGVDRVTLAKGELNLVKKYILAHGPDTVLQWYKSAANRGVREHLAIRYVCGCARTPDRGQA